MILPKPLEEILTHILKEEYDDFLDSLANESKTSIHMNLSKSDFFFFLTPQKISWFKNGYFLQKRPSFKTEPLFQAGAYYVQESSSMFVAEAVRQLLSKRKDNAFLKVLDLCAAPGGKSLLLESAIPEDSLVLCNEIINSRYKVLRHNLDKWGSLKTYSSQHAPEELSAIGNFFDIILVDAPCSGEGMIRKSSEVLPNWSEKSVAGCALRQQNILKDAITLLKPGGHLIYSTCTYNPSENINNAIWLKQNGFNNVPLEIDPNWNIVVVQEQEVEGYQFFPHKVPGEGFFISCFVKSDDGSFSEMQNETKFSNKKSKKKKQKHQLKRTAYWNLMSEKQRPLVDPWLEGPDRFDVYENPNGQLKIILKTHREEALFLENKLRQKAIGTLIGTLKGKQLVPSHQLALSNAVNKKLPSLELSKSQAVQFLKKENFELPGQASGWTLLKYEGVNLGWIKALPNRFNNYIPSNFRIT
ncbi:MAG: RNA methyltransferase [Saprospiraceae bacterium]